MIAYYNIERGHETLVSYFLGISRRRRILMLNDGKLLMKHVKNDRTRNWITIIAVFNMHGAKPTDHDILYGNPILDIDMSKVEFIPYGNKVFMVQCDCKFTYNEKLTAIKNGYKPYAPFNPESLYINNSIHNMVQIKNMYHMMVSEWGTKGVNLIKEKRDLFSKAYIDALYEASSGDRIQWNFPTASRIFEILEVLKKRNPHVEGVFDE